MRHAYITSCLLLFHLGCMGAPAGGGREEIPLADGWTIRPMSDPNNGTEAVPVTLPHTWNAAYTIGDRGYNRETMVYQRTLDVDPGMRDKRLFLYFECVNSVADVFVNHRSAGGHKGGYTAFCLEITSLVHPGANEVEVWAGNAFRSDVLPISGDFNVYGGIHRPVRLIVTGPSCISPLFHASPGVLVHQDAVSAERADITVETLLSLSGDAPSLTVRTSVWDADGRMVAAGECDAAGDRVLQPLSIPRPRLWDGRRDPCLYNVVAELVGNGNVLDRVEQRTGLRSFRVDADEGFFLNGQAYDLHGFNRHDDFKGRGSALTPDEYGEDIALLDEAGATVLRLAHYPHGEPIYDLCDEHGIVIWSEIPLCGPGGYRYTGYVGNVEENALQVAREMVYQKFNHPSVCFWGIFNELLVSDGQRFTEYDNPVGFVKRLDGLYHEMDPSRLTTFATCVDQSAYLGCSDLIAWNKYFGWMGAEQEASSFFDNARETSGGQPVGVSEYGLGGSALQHADPLYHEGDTFPRTYHPEEYQAICHEGYWASFRERPYLWAKIAWQFSDMQSSIKDEGDTPGTNDKGMVSYDRKTRKDAFYFYKANWNPEPMLHLCSKRFTHRTHAATTVKAYTNLGFATLYVNGVEVGRGKADELGRVTWEGVELRPGENAIRVEAARDGTTLADECTWTLDT